MSGSGRHWLLEPIAVAIPATLVVTSKALGILVLGTGEGPITLDLGCGGSESLWKGFGAHELWCCQDFGEYMNGIGSSIGSVKNQTDTSYYPRHMKRPRSLEITNMFGRLLVH